MVQTAVVLLQINNDGSLTMNKAVSLAGWVKYTDPSSSGPLFAWIDGTGQLDMNFYIQSGGT